MGIEAMKTCATCRFMAAPRDAMSVWDDSQDDICETEHRTCVRILHGNGGDLKYRLAAAEPALVVDGSGYAARLVVLPTFGCMLHEEEL